MMKKDIVNLDNNKIKDIKIDESIFGVRELPDLIHQFIQYL